MATEGTSVPGTYNSMINNKLNNIDSYSETTNYWKAATFAMGILRATPLNFESSSTQGAIALYEIEKEKCVLITNHHLLPRTDIEFICGSYINFEGLGRLILHPADIESITTNVELDATVIQLSNDMVFHLTQRGAKFLKIDDARIGEEVVIVKSPYGFFAIDNGIIHEIKDCTLYYTTKEGFGSSGSPILQKNFQAIGLHRNTDINSGYNIENCCIATQLVDIVAFHLKSQNAEPL